MTQHLTVRAPVAPLVAEPRVSAMQTSQRLHGHPLAVLEETGDWRRVRGDDGYEGWIHRGYLRSDDAPATLAARLEAGWRTALGCAIHDAAGVRRSLPLGALVAPGTELLEGDAVDVAGQRRRFPVLGAAIARTAVERFEGTSYEWGGVTPWGADCSGLVQSAFALHGVPLPRDAWQQAQLGADAGSDFAAHRPADLLFFSDREDGRITHVAIALGEARIVHLALGRGGYAVERLDDARDPYVSALVGRFRLARRVL